MEEYIDDLISISTDKTKSLSLIKKLLKTQDIKLPHKYLCDQCNAHIKICHNCRGTTCKKCKNVYRHYGVLYCENCYQINCPYRECYISNGYFHECIDCGIFPGCSLTIIKK